MITSISSYSSALAVSHSPMIFIGNTGGELAGQMRFNMSLQQVEVYDGTGWNTVGSSATMGLTPEAESAIEWASAQQKKEELLEQRMADNPALKDAYERFKVLDILTQDE